MVSMSLSVLVLDLLPVQLSQPCCLSSRSGTKFPHLGSNKDYSSLIPHASAQGSFLGPPYYDSLFIIDPLDLNSSIVSLLYPLCPMDSMKYRKKAIFTNVCSESV